MSTYIVTLVLFPGDEQRTVTVAASSAVDACTRAESLNPGTLARCADIVPAAS